MAVWRAFFVLGVVMAVRLAEEGRTGFTLEEAPAKLSAEERARHEAKALQSPWLTESTTLTGYQAKFQGLLSDNANNVTLSGMLSKVHFKGHDDEFTAALKGQNYKPEKYVPEVELTWVAAQRNGLSIGLIQGAHVVLEGSGSERRMYMMTEFLDSVDLFTLFTAGVRVNGVMAKMVVAQLLYSMMMLDTHGIYHRDIKLENFLLTPSICQRLLYDNFEPENRWRQNHCRIVLIDYGLSCASTFTMVEQFRKDIGCRVNAVGSLLYVAPEVIAQNTLGCGSQRSDIFSLGVSIYALFHGEFPHEAAARAQGQSATLDDKGIRQILRETDMAKLPIFDNFPAEMKAGLSSMLRPDIRCRPSAGDLWNSPLLDSNRTNKVDIRDEVVQLAEGTLRERKKRSFAMYAEGTSDAPWEQEFVTNRDKYRRALETWQRKSSALLQCEAPGCLAMCAAGFFKMGGNEGKPRDSDAQRRKTTTK